MLQSHKTSFIITLGLIFLLPLFFIPGGALALASAKSALIALGILAAALVYFYELWREGAVIFPKHYFVAAVALLPVVYLLSALLATPSSLSLFGYVFEVGTFGYMLLGSAALLLASAVFTDSARVLKALVALFLSLSILALFATVKILLGGDALALGHFFGNMGNPIGNWTDLGIVFGLLSVFAALAIGMIPMKGAIKILLYAIFFLSTALMAVISFQAAFIFTLAASILLFFYFSRIEKGMEEMGSEGIKGKVLLPIILGVVSLIFLINPTVSTDGTKLSSVVSGAFGVENAEVRPSLGATLGISKAVLSQVGLLGSGPNTFSHDWLIYKPANINTTPFWAASFPFGAGFLPTQIASTGIVGTALWIAFLVLLIGLAVKALGNVPGARAERFTLITTLFVSLYLWGASFFYAPSASVLMLAFIFTGLFVATLRQTNLIPAYVIDIRRSSQTHLASVLLIVLLTVGALAIGWTSVEKTVSAYHFNRAVVLSNTEGTPLADVENALIKAVNASPADVYFVALSRLNFTRAQMAAQSATGTPEENRAVFDESLGRSIEAARLAVSANPAGFENWVALGTVYSAMVPEPLSVEGAYENAAFAYNEAIRRNPTNPELPLLLAQLELNNDNPDNARSHIRNSIALKEDYADAYLMLAQLEVAAGNTAAAIASAENLAILLPENPGIHFELGLLKYSSQDHEGAVESLNRALALSPEYANAKYYLGLALANLGRFAEAQVQFEDLAQSNPEVPEVQEALEAVRDERVPEPLPSTADTGQ